MLDEGSRYNIWYFAFLVSPAGTVTRAQLASFLHRAAGSPPAANYVFKDEGAIPQFARAATDWLRSQGIVMADPFNPTGVVSRSDMAVWLWRASNSPPATPYTFKDETTIPSHARVATDWLYRTGVTTSDPFSPSGQVSRSQMAAMLWRWKGSPQLSADTLANTGNAAAVLWYQVTRNETITLPVHGSGTVSVDWGDGTSQTFNNPTHPTKTYPTEGYYRVRVTGNVTGFGFAAQSSDPVVALTAARDLIAVSSFGSLSPTNMSRAFYGATRLLRVPQRLPATVTNLSYAFSGPWSENQKRRFGAQAFNDPAVSSWDTRNITAITGMFSGATKFNQPIGSWNTANVTTMANLFQDATAFNQPLGSWSTGKVTTLASSFQNARAFNQPIGSWNTANVTTMASMFRGATAFNQPIGSWNTANVTTMANMFQGAAAFNQPLNSWNTGRLPTMHSMFLGATSFNSAVAGWNTANVVDMSYMFQDARTFNQEVGTWNTSKVKSMLGLFWGATSFNKSLANWRTGAVENTELMFSDAVAFNQPLGVWDVSKVLYMSGMFRNAKAFNQPLNGWNTSAVVAMRGIFENASSFNQPLNTWNTSKVTTMEYMFANAKVFNQNISNWDVKNVESWRMFRNGSALADANTPPKLRWQ